MQPYSSPEPRRAVAFGCSTTNPWPSSRLYSSPVLYLWACAATWWTPWEVHRSYSLCPLRGHRRGLSRRTGLHSPFWTLGCIARPVRRGHLAEKTPLQGAGRRAAQVSRCWLWLGLAQALDLPSWSRATRITRWNPGFRQSAPVHKWDPLNNPVYPPVCTGLLGGRADLRL